MVMTGATQARMLEKSYVDEVEIEALADGAYRTRSKHTPRGLTYLTTADSCTCPASAHCKHIARVRYELSRPATPLCPVCQGTGEVTYLMSYGEAMQNVVTSCRCQACQPAPANPWKGIS